MNLQQLRYICEVEKRGLNVSEAADALYTSQPGVSKQIRQLEEELGVDIFVRHGKRLVAVTEPGRKVLLIAERVLRDLGGLRQVGEEFGHEDTGTLTVATTHTQARYVLPRIVPRFMQRYPGVRLQLHQGSPTQCCEWVMSAQADLAIATEAISDFNQLVMLPCYQWNRSLIAPHGHPVLQSSPITLEEIARYPLITYDFAFTGRSAINHAFEMRQLKPNVVLSAIDADIIKTYVGLGLGIGLVASMAYDAKTDLGLAAVDCAHLFESSTTRIGLHKSAYLRGYGYAFIELFAGHLTRRVVDQALAGGGSDPGL